MYLHALLPDSYKIDFIMYAKTVLILVSVTTIFSCAPQPAKEKPQANEDIVTAATVPVDCSHYKTGRFRFHARTEGTTYLIDRTDSIQTETNLKDGHTTRTHIKWTDSCTYQLSYIGESVGTAKTPPGEQHKTLTTVINYTGSNYYTFAATMEGTKATMNDTLWLEKAE